MSQKPFLSVVMPVHDGKDWIDATLESVALEPINGIEFIVIDSSTTDAATEIINRHAGRIALQMFRRPDVKPWQSKINMGVQLSSADHVAMLHQDDLWLRGRVLSVRRWIANAPNAALHLAPTIIVDRYGRTVGRWTCPLPTERALGAEFFLERLLVQNFVAAPAPVFRRSAWLASGGMDEQLWYTSDWDIWAKLSSLGDVVYHNELTTAFRVHSSSLTVTGSRNAAEFREQMEMVVERHLHRIPVHRRRKVERAARASININVSLAAASAGNVKEFVNAAGSILALGPMGLGPYLRNSRLCERVVPRLRAKITGAF